MKKKIVFIILTKTHYLESLKFAQAMNSAYDFIFLCLTKLPELQDSYQHVFFYSSQHVDEGWKINWGKKIIKNIFNATRHIVKLIERQRKAFRVWARKQAKEFLFMRIIKNIFNATRHIVKSIERQRKTFRVWARKQAKEFLFMRIIKNIFNATRHMIEFGARKRKTLRVLKESSLKKIIIFCSRIVMLGSYLCWFFSKACLKMYYLHLKIYYFLRNFFGVFYLRNYLFFSKQFQEFILEHRPNLLILNEGNVGHHSEVFIKKARRYNIPSLVIPYTICSPTEPAEYFYQNRSYILRHPFLLLVFKIFFKKWLFFYKNKYLIRSPIPEILWSSLLDFGTPKPWVQESCTADLIIAESERLYRHYLKLGLPQKQIRILGNINFDLLSRSYRQKASLKRIICQELNLSPEKKWIVVAIPPNMIPTRTDHIEYTSYDHLIQDWLAPLKKQTYFSVIITLHPSLQKSDYEKHESDNMRIAARNTAEILPLADLYVASISATIKWAIVSGIPVINYDIYRLNYGDYLDVSSVIHVDKQEAYCRAVEKLIHNPELLEDLALTMKEYTDWGTMDGQSTENFKQLLDKMMNEPEKPQHSLSVHMAT